MLSNIIRNFLKIILLPRNEVFTESRLFSLLKSFKDFHNLLTVY